MFILGKTYTRAHVADAIGYPDDKRSGGPLATGYLEFNGAFYIFTNVGLAGRTGHDYPNRWRNMDLIWYGKAQTKLGQPQIERMIDGSCDVHLFWRGEDRAPFTYAGKAFALEVAGSEPVEIIWGFDFAASALTREGRNKSKPPVWRRGPRPNPGERQLLFLDQPTYTYLMTLSGATQEWHPRLRAGLELIKVGISVSPERRRRQHNSGFPPGFRLSWELVDTVEHPTGLSAFADEGRILEKLRRAGDWLGGEYGIAQPSSLRRLLTAPNSKTNTD